MHAVFLVCASCLLGNPEPSTVPSYLYQPAHHVDDLHRCPAVAYVPQPGDIMLATDPDRFWTITHNLALAGQPHNSAIVVARPDGSLATLEAGPNDTLFCRVLDLLPHLKEYEDKGIVWIRKRREPLTPQQCCRLTDFAMNETRFTMLARSEPERARHLLALAQADIDERWHYYEQLAGVERSVPQDSEES